MASPKAYTLKPARAGLILSAAARRDKPIQVGLILSAAARRDKPIQVGLILNAAARRANSNKGFTLIEIVVVMGLLAIVGGLSMLMNMETFRGNSLRGERDVIVSALQRARSQAINNICFGDPSACPDGKQHGVHVQAGGYVIFQGASFDDTPPDQAVDETVQALAKDVTVIGSADTLFNQLSGDVNVPTTIVVTSAGRKSTIEVNQEGRISWEDEIN